MKYNVLYMWAAALLVVLVMITRTSAYPARNYDILEKPQESIHLRERRATCDLFSFQSKWVTPNHAACAAHCLARGKKGGSCKNAICYCRN